MEYLRVQEHPKLRSPLLIAAFEGWSDASDVASWSARYLVRQWDAPQFADVDPEEFFVFTERRPDVRWEQKTKRNIVWPGNRFYYHHNPDYERDLIILRGVNVFPTQIEEIILTTAGAAPHFQLVLSKVDRMDHLTVRVEAAAQMLDPASRSSVDTSANAIASRIKSNIGVTVTVEILPPGTLERSTGKLQRVVDHR